MKNVSGNVLALIEISRKNNRKQKTIISIYFLQHGIKEARLIKVLLLCIAAEIYFNYTTGCVGPKNSRSLHVNKTETVGQAEQVKSYQPSERVIGEY